MNNKVYYCPECGEKFIASESLGFCPRCGVKIRTFKGGEKEISIQGENADDVKKVADYALSNSDERNEIKLSAPWGGHQQINISRFHDPRIQRQFIEDRSKVHLEYIKESEKTKRISLIASTSLFALGLSLIHISEPTRLGMIS